MRNPIAAIAFGLSLVSLPAAAEPPAKGQALFKQYCASCHGPSGKGDGKLGEALKVKAADLTRITERRGTGVFPKTEISTYIDGRKDVVGHGDRDMPVWGERFAEAAEGRAADKEVAVSGKLRQLVLYLESIQVPAAAAPGAPPAK